jgi:hypothetical protein
MHSIDHRVEAPPSRTVSQSVRRACPALSRVLLAAGVALFFAAHVQAASNDARSAKQKSRKRESEHMTVRPLVRDLAVRTTGGTAAEATGGARLKVAIDPVTGAIVRPAPGQLRELGIESLRHAQGPPLIVRRLDGSTIAYLDDRYMTYWVARTDSAGRIRTLCVDGAPAAVRALQPEARQAEPAKADR